MRKKTAKPKGKNRIAPGEFTAKPPLSQIYFYLTQGCNLACRHCWLAPPYDENGKKYPVLPMELFRHAVKEGKALGLSTIKLTGGEPLLHPDFSKIIDFIRQKELGLTIETNGMLVDRKAARAIASVRNRFVSVSLDGIDAATNDRIRGVDGAFSRATAAVQHLVGAGIHPQVIMTMMRSNYRQAEKMVRLAEKLGAGSVKFNILQPMERGEKLSLSSEALSIAEYIKLGRKIEGGIAKRTKIAVFFDYPMAFRSLGRISRPGGCGICGILGIIGVIPSGHYALCGVGEHIPELVFGKVGKDKLAAIWSNNAVLKKLRSGLPKKLQGICAECLMKQACLGSCIAQNYYRSRNLWAPYWFCESAVKSGLFPNSRKVLKKVAF
jgi:SynChlorMet cassette radical SAM/SPASM protein ScmF